MLFIYLFIYFCVCVCVCVCVYACMHIQNPLGQLKDLVDLKDQLEDIQRRVEDEIQAGVPAVRLTHPHTDCCWADENINTHLILLLLSSLGRQRPGFSFLEGFSGWVHCGEATVSSIGGSCHRNMYRNLCSTELRRSQRWKHRQRLHTQHEGRREIR